MDCEKFDRIVLDLLYDELDDLTFAAGRRHVEQCARCRQIASGLRATREVGVLPLIEPPEDLVSRILSAERTARADLPARQRVGRAVSVLAGYAMRPQLAMAALLLLMIGASLLLLRAKPGERDSVHVTERGVPDNEGETVAIVPLAEEPRDRGEAPDHAAGKARRSDAVDGERKLAAAAPAPAADEAEEEKGADFGTASPDAGDDPDYQRAMALYNGGRYGEAVPGFDRVAAKAGSNAATASLFAAQAERIATGCRTAAPRFERVSQRFRGSGVGHEATWQVADCYRVMGEVGLARRSYELLLAVAGYGDRARRALDSLGQPASAVAARKVEETPARGTPGAKAPAKAAAKAIEAAPPPAVDGL